MSEKYAQLSEENKMWIAEEGRKEFFEKHDIIYSNNIIESFQEMENHIDYYLDGAKKRGKTIYQGNYFLPCFKCHSVTCLCSTCYDKKCKCENNTKREDYSSDYRNSHSSMDVHGVGSW